MRVFCSICKDIYIPYSEVHVTNCGHLYHGSCISTWLRQHRTCPQCRASLSQPFRVYFDVEKDNEADPSALEHQIETLSDKLREVERHKKKLYEEKKNYKKLIEDMKVCAISIRKKNDILRTSVKALKEQVTKLSKQNEAVTLLESEVETWKNKVSTLERAETLIKGSVEEVNKMIESTPITELAVKQLCTYVGILKVQLHKIENKNIMLAKENKGISRALAEEKKKHSDESEELITSLREKNKRLENELNALNAVIKDYKSKSFTSVKPVVPSPSDMSTQRSFPVINLGALDEEELESPQSNHPLESGKAINHWAELVCAGPSRNFGFSLRNSRSFNKPLSSKGDKDISRTNEGYAFDGLGGRKKVRLGGPTPIEELEQLKKKKEKKGLQAFQHKKIIEYYPAGYY